MERIIYLFSSSSKMTALIAKYGIKVPFPFFSLLKIYKSVNIAYDFLALGFNGNR
jgi:hypothetical protein